jgi:hypothetical protein
LDASAHLRDTSNAYDYIAIVHRSLWDAIDPLLEYRATQGLRVVKVDVQDIYDEFSDGLVYPPAIRDFLSHAYHYWNVDPSQPNPPAPPRYVLLVGDGHYDFKHALTTQPNLIPPYLIDIDPFFGETAADNRFVSVDGPDDFLPDMSIGRIPARTATDVTNVVNKILAYEDPARAPDGDWQNRAIFVADNNTDPAGSFHALSDEVRTNWLPAQYKQDDDLLHPQRIYYRLNADYDNVGPDGNYLDEMRPAIKKAFNDTSLLLQWYGHGSKIRWGSTSMFNIFDLPTLAANTRLPFTQSYTCWTGYFINIDFNYQSLGETLLLQAGRGSIADLSPSGQSIGGDLLGFNQGVVTAIFRDRIRPVGEAVDAARRDYFAVSGSALELIDTIILFGDPATRLRLPDMVPATPTPTATATATSTATPTATPTAMSTTKSHAVYLPLIWAPSR